MIKFSYEVPIPNLYDFVPYQDFIFTLQHLYTDESYYTFVQKMQHDFDVWLDNSYNEQMKATTVFNLVDTYNSLANVKKVIAPDDPAWNVAQMQESIEDLTQHINRDKVLMVVNSFSMLRTLSRNLEIDDPSCFAVSYWTRPNMSPMELRQFKGVHFLGLLNPQELINYQPASCDTSMPIKLALKDQTIEEWMEEGCPHIHTKDLGAAGADFFNTALTDQQLKLSFDNITYLERYVREGINKGGK